MYILGKEVLCVRILVISDSHGDHYSVLRAIREQPSAKLIFFLGDGEYDIIVDALFGIGLSRNITGEFRKVMEEINKTSAKKILIADNSSLILSILRKLLEEKGFVFSDLSELL